MQGVKKEVLAWNYFVENSICQKYEVKAIATKMEKYTFIQSYGGIG